MSLKSLIQIIIILIIIIILGGVYFNYFAKNSKMSIETGEKKIQKKINNNISKKQETKKLSEKLNIETQLTKLKNEKPNLKKEIKKPEINNLVKDIEYLTTDKNGNKYKILATSGRTNSEDKNILDLDNVKGIITSKERSTIYIVSDFAEYNSFNLNSKFYQNVVISYEDKKITSDYFDVDIKKNIAIAYNDVVVTDPNSTMKAGKIILNIETKNININPENEEKKVTLKIK